MSVTGFGWLAGNVEHVLELAWAHLLLSVPPVLLSVLLAVPFGYLAHRRPRLGGPMLWAVSLLYAIPALPLLIIIPIVVGTPLRSQATMIIALSVYGFALLARSASEAFASVDQHTRQAAVAVGNSPRSIFWRVDLPLALPVLIAGIRVVTVSTISLVTIGALIGVPSLGNLLTDGFQRGIVAQVVTGIVGTIVLAIALDLLVQLIGRWATPWAQVGVAASAGAGAGVGAAAEASDGSDGRHE